MPSWLSIFDSIKPFFIGGLSGCVATACIQPIDMIKVRIQIKSEHMGKARGNAVSPFTVCKDIYSQLGLRGFYVGLGSSLTRLGTYKSLYYNYEKQNQGKKPNFFFKTLFAIVGGFTGATLVNPSDLALIRMQADSTFPKNERRNYRHLFDALYRISRDEGLTKLWTGYQAMLGRAIVGNIAMQACYDELKQLFTVENQKTRILSAWIAGFFTAVVCLPFDNCKTKMQKQKPDQFGNLRYKNVFHAMYKTSQWEGVSGLWVGLPTYYMRVAPHIMITLVIQDLLTNFIKKYSEKRID